ncbi:hypothetical protein C0995_004316, partial [Termitomyces sp. Mi166
NTANTSGSGTEAPLLMVVAVEQEVSPLMVGKGKVKALAMIEEEEEEEVSEEEFSLLTEWTSELLAQLLPKLTDVMEDEGLEGGQKTPAGNKAAIILASCKKQK